MKHFLDSSRLGVLSDTIHVERHGSPLDTLAAYLTKNLSYKPGEKDLVVLRHDVTIQWPTGAMVGKHFSTNRSRNVGCVAHTPYRILEENCLNCAVFSKSWSHFALVFPIFGLILPKICRFRGSTLESQICKRASSRVPQIVQG